MNIGNCFNLLFLGDCACKLVACEGVKLIAKLPTEEGEALVFHVDGMNRLEIGQLKCKLVGQAQWAL